MGSKGFFFEKTKPFLPFQFFFKQGHASPEHIMGARLPDDPAPFFETHVFVCGNRRPEGHERGDCAGKGSEKIRDYLKARVKELEIKGVRVNQSGCLDRCERGPCAVLYPEGIWYRLDSFEAADAILQRHIQNGGRVPEQMLD
jgi:(2Fe-2S) ferredoxin